ncbi:gluconate 2-dehydrogenase subunit 3 family protein [Campylobacter lari]|uniref:gluconate 2-dehydrogenase subunit 3 family protein n=1 Tax=Campylobacter lari TaxID=201 RepID=UPI00064025BF|nr:gluconate 2-dehydrogenase subunit 3 family protein [Campylobacter lari]AKJ53137.1 oxidoreductase [Campylobacter lari]EGH4467934.1 gluconate 2-dehydrogenase subunit 3 family protein [Campylobacter lari]MCR6517112.1 gluconate 2-dehydrogenase subunit 3 family protein [Campylobacter lari]MCR6519624.1 gluconate 2-dehydrogenase subunit 3 family protein [Campylobacter lari]MCR6776080.1 gluconate 2-dehydrogenase subunit 3 family protein [Campylobacter lari]
MQDNVIDRRNFFKLSLLGGGVVAASTMSGGAILHAAELTHAHKKAQGSSNKIRGKMFFQVQTDFDNLSAACERIYPKDEQGDGAIGLGVPYFIDNQLASAYGYNDREYLQGPFIEGIAEQGYQTPMKRNEIFLEGVKALEIISQKRYKKTFSSLKGVDQDKILVDLEKNKIDFIGFKSSEFFTLLRDMTIAGVLSDPIYGGNDNKNGWKMMQYPGAQMSYIDKITSDEFFDIEPMSLADMEG